MATTYLQRAADGERLDWDRYFAAIAQAVATRSTCSSRQVGALLVRPDDRQILSTGYNGTVPGALHCSEGGCPRSGGAEPPESGVLNDADPATACHAVHAEINALARLEGLARGTTMYTTTSCCFTCAKALTAAGVAEIVAVDPYPAFEAVRAWLLRNGVRVRLLRD
jgi:dCMP deaminase